MTTWRDLERRRHAAILAELREAPQVERSRGGSRTGSKTDDQERDRVIRVEEWRHEARTGIALREAREAMVLPDTPPSVRLSDELREVTDSPPLHIDRLCGQGHNVVVAAQWKAGKTTLAVARARAEVDGVRFLGEFATRQLDGNIGFWNNELERHEMLDYFRRSGMVNVGRVAVEHLKGRRIPLLSDIGAEWTIGWLREREVQSWYLDPWAVVCSWAGVNEYLDPEVGPLLERLDSIKHEAGVELVHISHHTGAANLNRPRGAARLSDWADAIWNLAREGDKRYLGAIGRRVELSEGAVRLEDDGALVFQEGGRREQAIAEARSELIAYVDEHPGCKSGDATFAIEHGSKDVKQAALNSAKERGLVAFAKRGPAVLLFPQGSNTEEQMGL